ncbi:hypothetical protein Tco_0363997 [Tanacetum coccineum]
MFALTVSTAGPKNIKEAMADHAWIKAMQDELHQFDRLKYPKDSGFELTAFSDANHVGCLNTRKSTSGGIQFLGEKFVSWMSKKQDSTAMSKAEVERGIIELYFVRTEYQLSDMFTKALSQDRFEYLFRRLGMRCLTQAKLEVLENETA